MVAHALGLQACQLRVPVETYGPGFGLTGSQEVAEPLRRDVARCWGRSDSLGGSPGRGMVSRAACRMLRGSVSVERRVGEEKRKGRGREEKRGMDSAGGGQGGAGGGQGGEVRKEGWGRGGN